MSWEEVARRAPQMATMRAYLDRLAVSARPATRPAPGPEHAPFKKEVRAGHGLNLPLLCGDPAAVEGQRGAERSSYTLAQSTRSTQRRHAYRAEKRPPGWPSVV